MKTVATRDQILWDQKCTKIDLDWGSLQRFSRPPSWNLGALLLREGRERKGMEWKVRGWERGGDNEKEGVDKGMGRERLGKGREGEEREGWVEWGKEGRED